MVLRICKGFLALPLIFPVQIFNAIYPVSISRARAATDINSVSYCPKIWKLTKVRFYLEKSIVEQIIWRDSLPTKMALHHLNLVLNIWLSLPRSWVGVLIPCVLRLWRALPSAHGWNKIKKFLWQPIKKKYKRERERKKRVCGEVYVLSHLTWRLSYSEMLTSLCRVWSAVLRKKRQNSCTDPL